jgi:hypothetical protein
VIVSCRAALLSLLLFCLVLSRAGSAEPVVFVVDARPEKRGGPPSPPASLGILDAVLVGAIGNMAQRAVDRKAAEIAAEFYSTLPFDVLSAAVTSIPVPPQLAAGPADIVGLPEGTEEALANVLRQRGAEQAVLVHYVAVPDRRFWSQLRVQRVTAAGGTLAYAPLVTAYYITGLPDDERHGRDGWAPAGVPRLESELRASFAELGQMWARIVADADGAGNPQPAWQSLPVLPKQQDDWTFSCRGVRTCKSERLVRLTTSRAWIGGPEGAVLASVDRATAARAPNFIAIPLTSGVP